MTAPDAETAAPGEALFSPLAAASIVLVGVFAFCALLVLANFAPDLKSGDNGAGHALSRSAIGYAGLAEALKLAGEPVVISRHSLPRGRELGLLVVTPPPQAAEKAVTDLGFAGPILVVLPKWLAAPDPAHRGWVKKVAPIDPAWLPGSGLMAAARLARRPGVSHPILHGQSGLFAAGTVLPEGPVESLQVIAAKGWLPLLADQRGGIVLARRADRPLFLLSDPDLLDNHGLKSLETLASGLAMVNTLRAGEGPVMFDVTLNGLGAKRGPLRLLFDPPFLAATLCLAAAAGLAGFQAFCRFGPVRTPPRAVALGKQALTDNSAALVRLARREHRMGGRYGDLTRDLAAKAVGAPRDLTGDALTSFLDRLSAQRGAADSLGTLTALAEHVPDRARLTEVAMRLFRWRLEMTRERQ